MPDAKNAATSPAAILIVSYNGMAYLPDCLRSIFDSPDAPPHNQIIIVDNASTDGSPDFISQNYPQITLLRLSANTGFVGGNNAGFDHVRKYFPHLRYLALLNQDTIVRPNFLRELIAGIESAPDIASVQVKLLFADRPNLLNSAGNKSHYLGFGFVSGYQQNADAPPHNQPREIAFASGAAMLLKIDAVRRDHLFSPEYFAYLEDAELGWYFRITGHRNLYWPAAVVLHRYQFSRNPQMYYRLENNRWRLLLAYYRWPTVALILPAILLMEFGLLFYFLRAKAIPQKLRSWNVFANLRPILRDRAIIQKQRKISDRQLTSLFISHADFAEVRKPLLTWIGNPLLTLYWKLARLALWW